MKRKILPTTIENWFVEEYKNNALEGSCRTCEGFVRVNRESFKNCMNQPGFCRFGRLEGDYSLYISTSIDENCPAFIEDAYNKETYLAECFLKMKSCDFKYNMFDGRTKEAKMIKKKLWNRQDIIDLLDDSYDGTVALFMNEEIRNSIWEIWRKKYEDELKWLWARKILKEKDYWGFVHRIQNEFNKVIFTNGLNEIIDRIG